MRKSIDGRFENVPDPKTTGIMGISEHSLDTFPEEEPDLYSVGDIRNA
jgi:hypothetical protein